MQNGPTQKELIKAHLLSGKSITPLEALHQFDCLCLAQRIADLKVDGLKIASEMTERGNKKRVAKYHLCHE